MWGGVARTFREVAQSPSIPVCIAFVVNRYNRPPGFFRRRRTGSPFKNSIMRLTKYLALVVCGFALLPVPVPVWGGNFDCAVVYDEFESLMNKRFLRAPDRFVRTLPGRISKQQFEGVSNADFHLYPRRDGMGIGILTTNQNIHAKFLFHWSRPMADGTTHVIIDEAVKYGRVADGYAPNRIGPFRLKPGMAIDIDSGSYVPVRVNLLQNEATGNKVETGDLQYQFGAAGPVLESANDARVQFPLETLCR